MINKPFYKNIKLFFFFTYIALIFIILLDPQKRIWWGYKAKYDPVFFCYDMPVCLRIVSLNLLNLSTVFVSFLSKTLNIKINNVFFFPHYFFATLSLTFVFYVIKSKISSFKIYIFIISYIFISIKIFGLPALFLYDYLALAYIFLIIYYFENLKRNFFSAQSIVFLILGTIIFEYLGFLYFGTIVLYNFFSYFFKKLYFQFKHLILIIVPLIVLGSLYFTIKSNSEYSWNGGSKNIYSLYEIWGKYNSLIFIIKSLTKYSFLLIFVFFFYFAIANFKFKNFNSLFKNSNFKIVLSLMINFLIVVSIGSYASGFTIEWQRQFLPFLFLSSIMSYYLIIKIKILNSFKLKR